MSDLNERVFGARIAFARHCGLVPIEDDKPGARLYVDIDERLENNLGMAHGGLICKLLDVAMGSTARRMLGHRVMTLDMHTTFVSPGRGRVTAEGKVLRAGRSIVFMEAEAWGEDGALVARASGTFKAVAAEK